MTLEEFKTKYSNKPKAKMENTKLRATFDNDYCKLANEIFQTYMVDAMAFHNKIVKNATDGMPNNEYKKAIDKKQMAENKMKYELSILDKTRTEIIWSWR